MASTAHAPEFAPSSKPGLWDGPRRKFGCLEQKWADATETYRAQRPQSHTGTRHLPRRRPIGPRQIGSASRTANEVALAPALYDQLRRQERCVRKLPVLTQLRLDR